MEKILSGEIGHEINLDSFEGGNTYLLNSYGGSLFEGLAIYDIVKGSDLEVGCIGVCASAATLPLLASPNSWGTPNSRYLIHNPSGGADGTAEEMKQTADELAKEQLRAVELYSQHLTLSHEEIQALMNEEVFITADRALEIGLIKSIKEYSKTAKVEPNADMKYNYNQFKMCIDMSENATKEDLNKIETLIISMKSLFKPTPKMVVLTTADGMSLDFGEDVTEEQIALGVMATVDGEPAEGSYVMPDGVTYNFTGGELVEIVPIEDENVLEAENVELKAQLEALESEKATMEASLNEQVEMNAKLKAKAEEITMEFNGFKTKFSSTKPITNTPAPSGETVKKKFNFKK